MTSYNSKLGFTLIETVVGIAVFSLLATMTSLLVLSSLKAARKASAASLVRTEGAYASGSMSQMLRYASGAPDCSLSNRVKFQSALDKGVTTFACMASGTDHYIASISGTQTFRLTSTRVQAYPCDIVCNAPGDVVDISFRLIPTGTDTIVQESAALYIDTEVLLRNVD